MSAIDILRCDLPQQDYLVWKWQPSPKDSSRQNQIRYGSSLRVRLGEVAAFFYSTGGGESPVDYIEGPADLILETKNLPLLANIIGVAYGGNSPFQAELYFINKGKATQLLWGVPFFDAFDPRFPDFPVPVRAYGSITLQISDVRKFVDVQRLENLSAEAFRDQIVPVLRSTIKSNLVSLASARGISLFQIGGRVEDLSIALKPTAEKLLEGFGATLRNFVVEGIELDDTSEKYKILLEVTRDEVRKNIAAQAEATKKNIEDSQKINSENLSATLEIQREALKERQTLQTHSDYLTAHQIDLQADVAKTAAQSLGKIGSGGHGGSGGSNDLAATAITLGLGGSIGAAFGQQIAGNIQKTAASVSPTLCLRCKTPIAVGANFCPSCGLPLSQPNQSAPATVETTSGPPPLPKVFLHIANDNQLRGILELAEVNHQLATGKLSGNDLGWYQALKTWQPLKDISGVIVPPELPPH